MVQHFYRTVISQCRSVGTVESYQCTVRFCTIQSYFGLGTHTILSTAGLGVILGLLSQVVASNLYRKTRILKQGAWTERPPTERPLNILIQTECSLDVSSTVTLHTCDNATPIHNVPGFYIHPCHRVDVLSLATSYPPSFT
jgi:hypothetical protein